MSRPRRDHTNAGAQRSAAERERARLERDARRGRHAAASRVRRGAGVAPARPDDAEPESPHEQEITIRRQSGLGAMPVPPDEARAPDPAQTAGTTGSSSRCAVRRDRRPIGIRRVRRTSRPIVTPPGDTPSGPAMRRRRVSVRARLGGLLAIVVLAVLVVGALLTFQPFGSAQGAIMRIDIPKGSSTGQSPSARERRHRRLGILLQGARAGCRASATSSDPA